MLTVQYIDFIYLIANIFRVFCISLFLELFFSKKKLRYSEWGKQGILVVYYILNCGIYLLLRTPIVTVISNMILFAMITLPYKSSAGRRIFAICSIFMLGVICEGIVARTAMFFISDFRIVQIFTYIVSDFLLYLVVLILRRMLQEKTDIILSSIHWLCIVLIPCISSIVDIILILSGYDQWVNITIISGLFAINMAFFYLYSKVVKECEVELQNQVLIQQNKAYHQQSLMIHTAEENIKRLQHDYKNHLIALKEMIRKNNSKELDEYFSTLEDKISAKNSFVMTGNEILDGLLNYKLQIIQELGVKTTLNIQIPEKINVDTFDLVVITGNLLDNAIRALQEQDNGTFQMDFRYNKGILFLHMKNSYIGTLKNKGNTFATTKKKDSKSHGIGLDNVKTVVDKYYGELEIRTEDNYFDVEILIYI